MRLALLLILATLGSACATPTIVEERVSGAACDERVIDLNRRLCAEKAVRFFEPAPDTPCGACLGFGVPLR